MKIYLFCVDSSIQEGSPVDAAAAVVIAGCRGCIKLLGAMPCESPCIQHISIIKEGALDDQGNLIM